MALDSYDRALYRKKSALHRKPRKHNLAGIAYPFALLARTTYCTYCVLVVRVVFCFVVFFCVLFCFASSCHFFVLPANEQERDATDVMRAFHSEDAFDRLKTLPVVKGKEIVEPNAVTKNFRKFRQELVRRRCFLGVGIARCSGASVAYY